MNPHFGTYIYVPKCILLIENLLKKPCSAEKSNHYQDAFWHIYMYRSVGSFSEGFFRTQIFHMSSSKPSPAPNTIKINGFCSLFLHFCIAVCFSDSRAPNTIKTNGFCSLFLHFCMLSVYRDMVNRASYPSICSFLHPIPPCLSSFLSLSLPA